MITDEFVARVAAFAEANGIEGEPRMSGVGGLSVFRSSRVTTIQPVFYEPVLCLVLQGAKQLTGAARTVTVARGQSVIVSIDLPVVSRVVEATPREPYLTLALRIDMGLLREVAGEIDLAAAGGQPARAMSLAAADEALVDAMERLFGLVGEPAAAPVLRPLIEREIHFWMLMASHGAMLRELCRADSHAARIARVLGVIRRDYAMRLRIGDLAGLAGMSTSAFYDRFKAITGTTPLQFQKRLRLMEARRLIASGELSVSAAAYRVGYESPTQFSREYARAWGAPPRTDLPARLAEPA
ncbi:MAG: AraC family transcriptional regulator [Oricola sp.]